MNYLTLGAGSLAPISRLLSWIRLPLITEFTVTIDSRPTKDFAFFMADLQIAGMGHTIRDFNSNHLTYPNTNLSRELDPSLLDLDDLRPCMEFHNLRRMNFDLQWAVALSDDELLMLASAWPHLEELLINMNLGWNRPEGGITPNGLALLLQTCPSLTLVALALDTRGYTQSPALQYQGPLSASSFARPFHIDVLDSVIKKESVDAIAAFLSSVVPHPDLVLSSWKTRARLWHPDLDLYRERWGNVHTQASEAIRKRQ